VTGVEMSAESPSFCGICDSSAPPHAASANMREATIEAERTSFSIDVCIEHSTCQRADQTSATLAGRSKRRSGTVRAESAFA
jgi:hypothetical protein